MKFNGSIAALAWTNWLCFELDPDHGPDPGSGFTPDFWILAGYFNKLWTDFLEILWANSCGVCTIWLRFEPDPDQSPDPGSGHVFKIARRIALKVMDGFQWNFMNEQPVNHRHQGRLRLISGAIRGSYSGCGVSVSGFYPDYWLRRISTTFGAEVAPTTGKSWVSCRSSQSKAKIKHNNNINWAVG